MKKCTCSFACSLSLFVVFLFLSFGTQAQVILPPPETSIFSPFTVALDSSVLPVNPFIIHADEGPLTNLTALQMIITADSNIQIECLRLDISRYWVGQGFEGPTIKSVSLYDGSRNLLAKAMGDNDTYFFSELKIMVSKSSQKTFIFSFDKISGNGIIRPWVHEVTGFDQENNLYYTCPQVVEGPEFNFVDPERTNVEYVRSPIDANQDTLFVYPGQYWHVSESYYTSSENWLPKIITAVDLTSNTKFDSGNKYPEFFTNDPWIPNDTIGTPFFDRSSSNAVTFKWFSNYSVGVNFMQSFVRWGNNYQAVGESQVLWSGANIVYSSPFFTSPREKQFDSRVHIYCVDGIRGDVDGDGLVTKEDFNLLVIPDNTKMYRHGTIDIGRGSILFGYPNQINTWLINVWLYTPDDPLVRDLGIGMLMSQRPPLPPATCSQTVIGKTMTIRTTGFAVNVSTVLPDGKIWNQAARVVNGAVIIELPNTNLKYQVEAVALPNSTTGVENADLPTDFNLNQNYPNPFNPTTTISYSLPTNGFVTLKVYDILGKEVAMLINEEKQAGSYTTNFDASNLASGTYIYRLSAGSSVQIKKMTLIK